MKTIAHQVFTVLLIVILFACKKDKPSEPEPTQPVVKSGVYVQPVFGSENFVLDSVYINADGYRVKFTDIKFYATNWENNGNVLIDAALFDYRETGTFLGKINGGSENFSALNGNIGVGVDRNHSDPSLFPSDSPLNIMNVGTMFWSWNSGYIFISIEGKADTSATQNGAFDQNFGYHIGKDENLGSINFTDLNWNKISDYDFRLNLKLDLQKFLDAPGNAIDLKSEVMTHSGGGSEALTSKALTNFLAALNP